MGNNIVERNSLVPHISKDQFDDVATEFLTEYCPEALTHPMAVPIVTIARKKMGLRIVAEYRLSEDFSIYGQICFNSGLVPVYFKDEDEFRDIKVRRGTILIDPDTLKERNIGCLNNTVAHECVHWYKHRKYHMYNLGAGYTKGIAFRYPIIERNEAFQEQWTDEDWMEWQANGIAPRILMPRQTFQTAIDMILEDSDKDNVPDWWVINKLADFYKVSKQSAEIRIAELNIVL